MPSLVLSSKTGTGKQLDNFPPFFCSFRSTDPSFHRSTVLSLRRFSVLVFPTSTGSLASGPPHVVKFNMAAAVAGSQLFCPFRALGFVANHVPLTLQTQGTETLVTTAVGSAFHVYNVGQFCVVSCTISLKRKTHLTST